MLYAGSKLRKGSMTMLGYCTVEEAVNIASREFNVSVSEQTIRTWLRDGRISGTKVGGMVWVVNEQSLRSHLKEWVRS